MIYPIVLFGDPVLKKKAEPVQPGSIDIQQLVDDMFVTMDNANGVGLAAPQIGLSVRVFVISTGPMEDDENDGVRKAFINAEILDKYGEEFVYEEGCLSIPGIREDVDRFEKIRIKYQDADWNWHEEELTDVQAWVVQHEYDHIEGVLFTDYLSAFKKRLLKNKLLKISKGDVKADYRVKAPMK